MSPGSEARVPTSAVGSEPAALAALLSETFALETDPDDSTRRLLELLVAAFADWGTIHHLDPDGTLRRVAAHHKDPALAPLVQRLLESPDVDPSTIAEVAAVLETGRGTAFDFDARQAVEFGIDAEIVDAWAALGFVCGAIVPLRSGRRTVGVLSLMAATPGRFPAERVREIQQLVAEGALLADTARLARRAEAEHGAQVRVRTVLDSLLGDAPLPTVVVDADLRVLHHNGAVARLKDAGDGRSGAGEPGDSTPPGRSLAPLGTLLPALAEPLTELAARVLAEGRPVEPLELTSGAPDRRCHWQVNAFPIRRSHGELFGVGLLFVDVSRQEEAVARQQESRARLDLSLEVGGMGSWDWDLLTDEVEWSSGMAAITGFDPAGGAARGADVIAGLAGDDATQTRAKLVAAARTGDDYEDLFRLERAGGEVRWIESRARVIAAPDGVPVRMIGVSTDVTERQVMEDIKLQLLEREHQARLAAESSRERLALLAEVSGGLASLLDPTEVCETLARLLVPRLADWCAIDLLGDDGDLAEVAVIHIDPRLTELVRRLRHRGDGFGAGPDGIEGLWSVRRAMRTGRSERVEDITDDDLASVAADPDDLRMLRTLMPRSALVAPMVARGRVLGGITVVTTGHRAYDADDQALLENIAGRAATAVDTATLFDSRSEVARALQQTLLPPALPEIPGLDVWADYRVAEGGIEIGGDFYDLFETEHAWYVVLGDVCGKGPAAAAVTGLFRHTLRAVAPGVPGVPASTGPAALLRATNDAILGQIDDTRFVTAVLAALTPGRGNTRVSVACGGHPRPILVRADGTVERVDATGTLLGVLPDPPLHQVGLGLGAGDALVLYTDGVTEARDGPEQFGESRLMEALGGAAGLGSARAVSEHLIAAVDAFRDPQAASDDIAVIAIRVPSLEDR